ncbi:hypothetical protein [Neorhizobium sp. JUb45]|uniref:hypothetical protein n=1 Tax=unclassified Neorhizobium TaxID=2629175 RepID=UPI00105304DE|nr:hypothetical protein [Neorhizobium sp. JUb45]TCR04984.1 hypothetical protein EDF70_1021100 [Neorhizobium sp. JUb45]
MGVTQAIAFITFNIIAIVVACWVARQPKSTPAGVALGAGCGVVLMAAGSALVGLFAHVLPFGQMDFWLASWIGPL